jgi:hypothetical protein
METERGPTDTTDLTLSTLEIPSDILEANISFSGLDYKNPEHLTFSYRIQEIGNDFLPLGTQRFVNLVGLKPGHYTLLIKARSGDGIESDRPIILTLNYLPKWYQTWWFRVLVVLAIAGFLYTLYRYRIRQLEEQQRIRKQIASDLHDDIGSILHTVKLFTHMAKREPNNPEHLDRIENASTQATLGLRDMLWVLDDNRDSCRDLMERIRTFVQPLADVEGIELRCVVDEEHSSIILTKAEKRNLLLIAKETLHNSFKYSDCRQLDINLQVQDRKISLRIHDDGKGFDPGQVREDAYGLTNIRQRAKQIFYTASIESTPGGGTTITLTKI